mgnify:CR=1 FL=1
MRIDESSFYCGCRRIGARVSKTGVVRTIGVGGFVCSYPKQISRICLVPSFVAIVVYCLQVRPEICLPLSDPSDFSL